MLRISQNSKVTVTLLSRLLSSLPFVPVPEIAKSFTVLDSKNETLMPDELIKDCFGKMISLRELDQIGMNLQRQGRISFYMQSLLEEAATVGSSAGMEPQDWMFMQYRETGAALFRGYTVFDIAHQLFATEKDQNNGRQMPMHFGDEGKNIVTVSSTLATQLPHAVGAAYAFKREGKEKAVIVYFGEGASSEGDFHAAMNFASTLDCPVVFFARNNGYAISTPTADQFKGDGLVSRAAGYGMKAIRVDGTDLLAVHDATKMARQFAVENSRPVFIEAMTYRGGHHSTSDDSSLYRPEGELEFNMLNKDPIKRIQAFMMDKGWINEEEVATMRSEAKKEVLAAISGAEKTPLSPLNNLFDGVYSTKTPRLEKQEQELMAHLAKYSDEYPLLKKLGSGK